MTIRSVPGMRALAWPTADLNHEQMPAAARILQAAATFSFHSIWPFFAMPISSRNIFLLRVTHTILFLHRQPQARLRNHGVTTWLSRNQKKGKTIFTTKVTKITKF